MNKRFIRVHPPVVVRELDGSVMVQQRAQGPAEPIVIAFVHFVASRLRDQVFGRSLETVEACDAIRNALAELKPDDEHLVLDELPWRLLVHAVRTPGVRTQYEPIAALSVLHFMRSIVDAPAALATKDNGAAETAEADAPN